MKNQRGIVKWFNDSKGYGFARHLIGKCHDLELDVFVHYTHIKNPPYTLEVGQQIKFDAVETKYGFDARNIRIIKSEPTV